MRHGHETSAVPSVMGELVQRALQPQPVPTPSTVALLAALALMLVIALWPITRMVVTIAHEGGHAVVARLTGRTLTGIRLHSDTSGLTMSKGAPSGPGMVATLLAGYVAPGLVGLAAALLLSRGYAVALLWTWVVLLALMLLFIRNLYGLAVMLVAGGLVLAATWWLSPVQQSWLGYLVTWTLLFAAPRPPLELLRRPSRTSDAGQLAGLTTVPAALWTMLFLVINLACLAAGVTVLVPGVLRQV